MEEDDFKSDSKKKSNIVYDRHIGLVAFGKRLEEFADITCQPREFMALQAGYDVAKRKYHEYKRELAETFVINENNPVMEESVCLTSIPFIQADVERLDKYVSELDDAYSEAFIQIFVRKN